MSWRFIHQSAVWAAFLSLLLVGNPSETLAQFKDLDQSAPTANGDAESLELVPAEQSFVAPEVEVFPQAEEQPTTKKTAATESTAKTKVAPKPVVDQLEEVIAPTPEPIPMPELQEKKKTAGGAAAKAAKSKPDTPATEKKPSELREVTVAATPAAANPMQAFSRHRPNGPELQSVIETAKFNGIQPGVSSKEELLESWGEAVASIDHDDESVTLVYQVPSFKQIDVTVNSDAIVSGIIVHLEKPVKISHVTKELAIGQLEAVPIPDEYGEILGQAYPERGLLLSFTENLNQLRVSTILLEPVSAEMFRLRAQYDFGHHYERSLADLDQAISLDPKDSEAYWMRAQYLDVMGQSREALKSAQKAIRIQPTNPLYRLTRARLYAKTNRLRTGIEEVKEVIRELDLTPDVSGRAHNLLGDMYAMGRKADHQMALKHHLKAIDFSVKAVSDRRFAVRRAAKHVLVNAHVSVARDIAMGNFQRQSQVVPKWLLRATEMADEFISDDQGDNLLQMQIFRDTLASYAELNTGNFDAEVAIDEALKTGRQMIADATDDYYKIQVERMLAESLYHAAKIHRARGRYDTAMKFANNALGLLDGSREGWEHVAHDHYLEGQLLFLVGSVYAVRDSNHFEAVEYYAKARRRLANSPGHTSPLYSDRSHGEMYVSMGLSYWETEDKEEAMQLTLQGATIMKDAVEEGTLKLDAMSVPYGNLATMHSELGNSSKSQEFAKLVAKIDQIGTKTR